MVGRVSRRACIAAGAGARLVMRARPAVLGPPQPRACASGIVVAVGPVVIRRPATNLTSRENNTGIPRASRCHSLLHRSDAGSDVFRVSHALGRAASNVTLTGFELMDRRPAGGLVLAARVGVCLVGDWTLKIVDGDVLDAAVDRFAKEALIVMPGAGLCVFVRAALPRTDPIESGTKKIGAMAGLPRGPPDTLPGTACSIPPASQRRTGSSPRD